MNKKLKAIRAILRLLVVTIFFSALIIESLTTPALAAMVQKQLHKPKLSTANITEPAQFILKSEQWALTKNGSSVLQLPVIRKLINTWLATTNTMIEIQYPGGEEGELWVTSLTHWLVALGIPSQQLLLTPASGADDRISFYIIQA